MEREPADSAWRCTAFSLAEGTSVSKEPCLSRLRFLLSSSYSHFHFLLPLTLPSFPLFIPFFHSELCLLVSGYLEFDLSPFLVVHLRSR